MKGLIIIIEKVKNDYGIQNLYDLDKNKNHKDGPMVILPNKMLN